MTSESVLSTLLVAYSSKSSADLTAETVTADNEPPRARLTLLSLPDEILERVFVCLYEAFQYADSPAAPPPMQYLLICHRLSPLVRRLWYSALRLDRSKALGDQRLGELSLQPPEVLSAVQALWISFFVGDSLPIYTTCAQLRCLRTIHLVDGSDAQGTSYKYASLQRLLQAFPTLDEIVFHRHVRHLTTLTLPATLRRLTVEAAALEGPIGQSLKDLHLRYLKLYWAERDNNADEQFVPAVPWEYLETLVLVFRSAEIDAVLHKLGEQVHNDSTLSAS